MPAALLLPILLRAAGPLAFILSALIAGAMNRAVILVLLLAIAATLTTALIRAITPSPTDELMAALNQQEAPVPKSPFAGSLQRFGAGIMGYAFVFGFAVLVSSLFQVTELEPRFTVEDSAFLIIPATIAVIGASVSARMGFNQMADMMGQMREAYTQMRPGEPYDGKRDEAFTVDGEVIHKQDDKPS
ncbi:MAG: hypothetical protein AAFZ91_02300 [Pseudomonadota bacterium]